MLFQSLLTAGHDLTHLYQVGKGPFVQSPDVDVLVRVAHHGFQYLELQDFQGHVGRVQRSDEIDVVQPVQEPGKVGRVGQDGFSDFPGLEVVDLGHAAGVAGPHGAVRFQDQVPLRISAG